MSHRRAISKETECESIYFRLGWENIGQRDDLADTLTKLPLNCVVCRIALQLLPLFPGKVDLIKAGGL
jgi:hypothetical protein